MKLARAVPRKLPPPLQPDALKAWAEIATGDLGETHRDVFASLERSMDETGRRGRPKSKWHDQAFAEIDALVLGRGDPIKAACRAVEPKYAGYGINAGTLRDLYVRHSRQRLGEQVARALLAGDIPSAAALYRRMLKREQQTRDYRPRRRPPT
jgi:hypothetical protein